MTVRRRPDGTRLRLLEALEHGAGTTILYALPAVLVAANWLRLEEPRRPQEVFAVVLLALLAALARPVWLRAPAVVAATLVALAAGFRDVPGGLAAALADGALQFFDVTVPFDPSRQAAMHAVTVLAVFAFCLALAFTIAARRGLAASALLVAGAAWPATLGPGGGEPAQGALLLAFVLILLVGCRPGADRVLRPALATGAVALLCAVVASSSPAVAKDAFLDWKAWDPYTQAARVTVSYVWDSDYTGIRFPKRRTPVLTIKAPPRSLYWRATTLDRFTGYGWAEDLSVALVPPGTSADMADPLLPRRARNSRRVRQEVTVEGLRDRHLVGASIPVAYDARDLPPVTYAEGGIALAPHELSRGDRYSVWSVAATPTPRQLGASRPLYPPALLASASLNVVPTVRVPPFGTRGREAVVRSLFREYDYDERLAPYAELYAEARRIVGNPRNPYAAVIALESWFRTAGGFIYDERPPAAVEVPPLVDFAVRTKRGYCQQYAGAMALMLRYLGIPARVAAGFTSGVYDQDQGAWTVTDHNAHTWVEVWFHGYGWLPFDPTPGRGALAGSYTVSSRSFDSPGAAEVAVGAAATAIDILRNFGEAGAPGSRGPLIQGERAPGAATTTDAQDVTGLWVLLATMVCAVAFLGLGKLAVRRSRYLTRRDARGIAAACRRELVDFLVDQRVEVPRSASLGDVAVLLEQQLDVRAARFAAEAGA
ncbi:MAG: transglutaminase domain-containing protein, partial [Actinobacteria bacterium]|nr:transglutaminase domain-containing protein [Actinomycetota bacterium]